MYANVANVSSETSWLLRIVRLEFPKAGAAETAPRISIRHASPRCPTIALQKYRRRLGGVWSAASGGCGSDREHARGRQERGRGHDGSDCESISEMQYSIIATMTLDEFSSNKCGRDGIVRRWQGMNLVHCGGRALEAVEG